MTPIEQTIPLRNGRMLLPSEAQAWFGRPVFWTFSEANGGVLVLRLLTVELQSRLETAADFGDGTDILAYGKLRIGTDGSLLLPAPCETWRTDRVLLCGSASWLIEIYRDTHALDVPEVTEEDIQRVLQTLAEEGTEPDA